MMPRHEVYENQHEQQKSKTTFILLHLRCFYDQIPNLTNLGEQMQHLKAAKR